MIVARSPLRIDLAGGGTDTIEYCAKHGGRVVSMAIDQYVYVSVNRPMNGKVIVKYRELEVHDDASQVQHPIVREALDIIGLQGPVEITTSADIPAGTGLGSSGSFTTALLKALHAYQGVAAHRDRIAEEAFEIEGLRLGRPIGRQDQYAAACGGITDMTVGHDGRVTPSAIPVSPEMRAEIEDHMTMFFTGYIHQVEDIMAAQGVRAAAGDEVILRSLAACHDQARRCAENLLLGGVKAAMVIMTEKWKVQRQRGDQVTNPKIDRWYQAGLDNGGGCGMLAGAGGGGFLVYFADDLPRLRAAMAAEGLPEVRFGLDLEGTKLLWA